MKSFMTKYKTDFFATCPRGLENLLEIELLELGVSGTKKVKSGVHFQGLGNIFIDIILNSRIASRVYKKLYSFEVNNEKQLLSSAKEIKWKSLIADEQTFRFSTQIHSVGKYRSKFTNSLYISQVLKDAVVERMAQDKRPRPNVDTIAPDIPFMVQVAPIPKTSKERIEIYIDLTMDPICNRGYRAPGHEAPLRENLAAGIVATAALDPEVQSYVLDGMCGSATLLIESFMQLNNIPPAIEKIKQYQAGVPELWHFQHYQMFTKDEYLQSDLQKYVERAMGQLEIGLKNKENHIIHGVDIDTKALEVARMQVNHLGFNKHIKLEENNILFKKTTPQARRNIFFANLPYSHRMGEEHEVEELYQSFGQKIKDELTDFDLFLLTPREAITRNLRINPDHRIHLKNGALNCELLTLASQRT